jgi:drug/metabolite transporter (DMT)-like permease
LQPHLDVHGRGPRWLAPLAVALIWGVNVPVMKAALGSVHPLVFNALRLTASVAVLGLVDRWERRDAPAVATPWRVVVPLGLATSLFYQVLFVFGIANTSATNTGFLVASGPLWTAAIARAFGLERIGGRAWGGLAIASVGTCIVAVAKSGTATVTREGSLLGNGLLLLAMVVWALCAVLSRPVLTSFPATRLAFLATLISLPGHWALALPHVGSVWGAGGAALGTAGWAAVLYSGALSTGIAYALWNRSLLRIGPARTSAFTNLVPFVAVVIAWVALDERPTGLQLAGGALILLGIAALRSSKTR